MARVKLDPQDEERIRSFSEDIDNLVLDLEALESAGQDVTELKAFVTKTKNQQDILLERFGNTEET